MLALVIGIGIIALVGVGRFFKTLGVLVLIGIAAVAVVLYSFVSL